MKAERQRVMRLKRLERLRAIAKQAAAAEAAQAESTLAQLEALSERTRRLAADYAARGEARDGGALQHSGRFAEALQSVAVGTAHDANQARARADAKLAVLAEAERRRSVVKDRIGTRLRALARRAVGTGLE
jgi:hypothetical protein